MDIEVSRKKIRFGIFGESRGSEAHFLTRTVYQRNDCTVKIILLAPEDAAVEAKR